MSMTTAIIDDVLARLRDVHGKQLAVDYFPDQPATYRLNHPTGAVLVGYSRSNFADNLAMDSTLMARDITIPIHFMFSKLHGVNGVITYLDIIRETLTGYKPVQCEIPLKPLSESFVTQNQGVWQYAQDYVCRATQIQHYDYPISPFL